MNSDYDNKTGTCSDIHLSPPSPDGQEIFRRSTTFDSAIKYPQQQQQQQQQNPRKKRTKMIRLDDSTHHNNISKPKKPDPSAPKITRPCSECGKKFWSWKALFGHMRCHPERQWRGINPPPNFKKPDSGGGGGGSDTSYGDDFGTRMTDEDHHVATCLLMLANGPISACDHQTPAAAAMIAAAAAANNNNNVGLSDSDTVFRDVGGVSGYGEYYDGSGGSNGRFECSSCKKVFGSHQALGGHRASHKNVKGCFAITKTEGEEDVTVQEFVRADDHERILGGDPNNNSTNNPMVTLLGSGTSTTVLMPLTTHQCSICLRVFSSGQALGGHKRCHWEKIGDESGNITQGLNVGSFGMTTCGLDLNMPAPVDDPLSSNLALDLRLGL